MKSKGFTYLLFIVVAIVWYNVFFRIKSNLMGEDVILPPNVAQLVNLKAHVRDTFVLHANYRDPFEGIGEKSTDLLNPNMPIIPVQPVYVAPKIKPVHQWPKVKYYGIMKKGNSKMPLCVFSFDDVLMHLRQGDSFYDGYVVRAIYRDSLVIQNKSLKKTFMKM